nr:hypothetical protein Iba_chr11aCG13540 [Ipomoea batatas]
MQHRYVNRTSEGPPCNTKFKQLTRDANDSSIGTMADTPTSSVNVTTSSNKSLPFTDITNVYSDVEERRLLILRIIFQHSFGDRKSQSLGLTLNLYGLLAEGFDLTVLTSGQETREGRLGGELGENGAGAMQMGRGSQDDTIQKVDEEVPSLVNPGYNSDYQEFIAEFLAKEPSVDTPPTPPQMVKSDTSFPLIPTASPWVDPSSPLSQTPSVLSTDSPTTST